MVKHLQRRLARAPHRGEREQGSLILDILIGMAVFALIAIIAISAIGQYRARAYVQTAVSDAEQAANAVNGLLTDNAADPDFALPSGVMTEEDLDTLGITLTTSGAEQSVVVVIPGSSWGATDDNFEVCVEHRSAYALYATDLGGIYESGNMDENYFEGCDEDSGPPVCPDPIAYRGVEFRWSLDEVLPYPAEVRALGLGEDELFLPAHVPGLTEAEWAAWMADYDAWYADGGPDGLPQNFLNRWTIYGASDWTRQGNGEYLDGDGAPVTYIDCATYD